MLVLITLIAIPLAYVAQRRAWNLKRKAAYEALLVNGVNVECGYSRTGYPQDLFNRVWYWLTLDDETPPVAFASDSSYGFGKREPAPRAAEKLALLSHFPEIESIDLNGWDELTDEHLRFLANMPLLRSFRLANSPRVRGEFLAALAKTQKLVTLDLRGISSLEGERLKDLSKLELLENLVLIDCPLLTDDSLQGVNLPSRVGSLEVEGEFGDRTLVRWLGQFQLECLTVDCPITARTTKALDSHSNLRWLEITNAPLQDGDFAFLKQCQQLDILALRSMPIHGAFLQWIPNPAEVSILNFSNTLFEDTHLAVLTKFEDVHEIDLACTPLSGEGFGALKGHFHQTMFKLWGTRFSEAGKAKFAEALSDKNEYEMWLPSNWRAADMSLIAHLPKKKIEHYVSYLAVLEPNANLGNTYVPDQMLQDDELPSIDRCPEALMSPVLRLHEAASEDATRFRNKVNGFDIEQLPSRDQKQREGIHGK